MGHADIVKCALEGINLQKLLLKYCVEHASFLDVKDVISTLNLNQMDSYARRIVEIMIKFMNMSAECGNVILTTFLVSKLAFCSVKTPQQRLVWACSNGLVSVAELLISSNVGIKIINDFSTKSVGFRVRLIVLKLML